MTVATQRYTVVVHEAEEGGYWAEVIELPGCVSQGETMDELRRSIKEAIDAVLLEDTGDEDIRMLIPPHSESSSFVLVGKETAESWDVSGETGSWTSTSC